MLNGMSRAAQMKATTREPAPRRAGHERRDDTYFALSGAMIDRALSLRGQIYTLVRRLIITGALKAGEPINEIAIADRLGVSRTPVREAVKRLSDEGLVEVFAQSGTFVAQIGREAIEEAFVIRSALEVESVTRAAKRMNDVHARNLRSIIQRHEDLLAEERFIDAIESDDAFHRYIADINQLHMLWRTVDICKAQIDRGRLLVLPKPGQGKLTLNQHKAILVALEKHDSRKAARAMRDHLDATLENILKHTILEPA